MRKNNGYTLLFAVLVSSVVLSVGISILTISKKEFLLSSSARESVSAFYAADAGLECAQYHEDNTTDFATATDGIHLMSAPGCMNQVPDITIDKDVDSITDLYSFSFELSLENNNSACAVVTVFKKYSVNAAGHPVSSTTMVSRGYNLGWDGGTDCNKASPRRVERAIEYTY